MRAARNVIPPWVVVCSNARPTIMNHLVHVNACTVLDTNVLVRTLHQKANLAPLYAVGRAQNIVSSDRGIDAH